MFLTLDYRQVLASDRGQFRSLILNTLITFETENGIDVYKYTLYYTDRKTNRVSTHRRDGHTIGHKY